MIRAVPPACEDTVLAGDSVEVVIGPFCIYKKRYVVTLAYS
jgi:hypothetical protein